MRDLRKPAIALLAQAAALVITVGNASNFSDRGTYLGAVDVRRLVCNRATAILLDAYSDHHNGEPVILPSAEISQYILRYKRMCLAAKKILTF